MNKKEKSFQVLYAKATWKERKNKLRQHPLVTNYIITKINRKKTHNYN